MPNGSFKKCVNKFYDIIIPAKGMTGIVFKSKNNYSPILLQFCKIKFLIGSAIVVPYNYRRTVICIAAGNV